MHSFVSRPIALGLFVALSMVTSAAYAEAPVIVLGDTPEQELGGSVEFALDSSGANSFSDAWSDSSPISFAPSDKDVINLGFSDAVIWIRFALENRSAVASERLFSVGYPLLDKVDIEVVQSGTRSQFAFGDLKPFAEREFYHRNFIIPVVFQPGERVEFRMRVHSESSLRIPLTVWEPDAFYKHDGFEMLLNGLYYGLMLVMALYNAFVYFSIRERSYLIYVCFVISAAIAQLAMSGLSYQFLWPSSPWWAGVSVVLFLALGTFFAGWFALEFLQLRSSFRKVSNALSTIVALSSVVAVCAFILPYNMLVKFQVILILSAVPFCIAGGILSWRAGSAEARIYSIAWFSFLGGAMFLALTFRGVLPPNAITTRGHQVGAAMLVVLLSLALARKLKSLQEESESLANELFGKSEELSVALERAKSADQLKGEILANLSHELRTPLNALINIPKILTEQIDAVALYECSACREVFIDDGDGDMGDGIELTCPECGALGLRRREELRTSMPPTELMHLLHRTTQSGGHLAKTFTDMLEFAKLESGTVRPTFVLAKVSTVLQEVTDLHKDRSIERGVTVNVDVDEDCDEVPVDRELTELLLSKLIENAIEFSPPDSTVELQARQAAGAAGIVIDVRDSGPGISKQDQDIIFESFRQVDGGHTRSHPGVGLGLSIARGISQSLGWTIGVSSAPGEGATFSVSIPVLDA